MRFQWHFPTPPQDDCLTVIGDLLRLISKLGEIKLRSASYADPPRITLNFFANNLGLVAMRKGVRFVKRYSHEQRWYERHNWRGLSMAHAMSLGRNDEQSDLGTLANWIP